MGKRDLTQKGIAYHEAGHAVMSYLLHRRISKVTIIPDGDALGYVNHGKGNDLSACEYEETPKIRDGIENLVMICLAGDAAQTILRKRDIYDNNGSDIHNAVDYLLHISNEKEINAYLDWLQIRTKVMLQNPWNWKAVEELAKELLRVQTVGGRRARQFIKNMIEDYFLADKG